MRPIRLATRGSKLALTQTGHVKAMVEQVCPGIEITIVEVSTLGDRDNTDFLYKAGSTGYFTTEVESALLNNQADFAVHSLKDLPTAITPGLQITAIPVRQDPADALLTKGGATSVEELPQGAKVGTSSVRRIAQLLNARSDLNCQPLRGNIDTRVRKLAEGEYDAIILAAAGLNRAGMADKISGILPIDKFIPAPAQGALAVQTRSDDDELIEVIAKLDDANSRLTAETERSILAAMHGGCSIPLGVHCSIDNDDMTINAVIADITGKTVIRKSVTAPIAQAEGAADEITKQLIESGGRQILDEFNAQRNKD